MTSTATDSRQARATTRRNLGGAVHRAPALSRTGLLERAFTAAFSGLVYPQIWEDPVVDMEGLALGPDSRIATIASGGCNVLSYLTAGPARILAVDLNAHHVALTRLKLAGARHLPHYQAFVQFFGAADRAANRDLWTRHLRDRVDPATRAHWDGRDWLLRRRIGLFARGLYRHGLLGRFIGAGHLGARLMGVRLAPMLAMRDTAEQAAYFEAAIAPAFDRWPVRWITGRRASLFGLGIPPAQYEKLAAAGGGAMHDVLRARLRKLLCDFPISENYFAWQALARAYAPGDGGPLPPYLESRNFAAVRAAAERVTVENRSLTERLAEEPDASLDAYVLLDAQDWMTDAQLDALWSEITRTARPGARVLFRTADGPSLLPGRLDPALLGRWSYREAQSRTLTARDRSAIYGGVHLYVLEEARS